MVGGWIRKALGVGELIDELRLERAAQREMMGQAMRTAEAQAHTMDRMVGVLDKIYKSYETDGTPPEARHLSEEMEDDILNEAFYGPDKP